ncbi:septum site-determining protein Ssd [Propionibacteriaceae bacterium Y2011]|uniref:septum site-determining protein Ssd n=1 Tax=Microlunatus sp. Y2014 TaxID=3418488 RepID=UPI003B4B2705
MSATAVPSPSSPGRSSSYADPSRGTATPVTTPVTTPVATTASRAAPVIITADDGLLDQAMAAVAAAGGEARVAHDIPAGRGMWRDAELIMVGVDLAAELGEVRPPRGARLFLLGDRHDREALCTWSVGLGAAVVVLPEQRGDLTAVIAGAGGPAEGGRIVAVRGASGGVGASTVAAGLAWQLAAAGRRTVLVDADPTGGGIDLLVGAEGLPGWRWPELAGVQGHLPRITDHLPDLDGLGVLAMSREPGAARPTASAMLAVLAACRAVADAVVVDVGRTLDEADTTALLEPASVRLLLVADDVRGVAAAEIALGTVGDPGWAWSSVVRSGATTGLGEVAVAEALGHPSAGSMPYDRSLQAALLRGEAPGRAGSRRWRRSLRHLAGQVLA